MAEKGSGLQPRLHEYSQRRKERSSIGEAKLCSKYTTSTHVPFSSYNFQPDAFLNVAVPSQAEKLRLYRELDSIRKEEALVEFERRLVDRFGALPEAARELLNVVRLRWEAVRLGMERVKVKNGLMIVHFVGEQNSPYYKSDIFMDMLRKITAQPDRFVLKQHNNRLAMTVRRVSNVAEAVTVLRNL